VEPARTARTAAAVGLALATLAGCGGGGRTIDAGKAARFVRQQLLGPPPSSIDCPKGVEAKKGETFGCTLVYPDGTSATVTVHVVSDSGRIRVAPSDFRPHSP
jgi:Domain of unknown function (DUF4333)